MPSQGRRQTTLGSLSAYCKQAKTNCSIVWLDRCRACHRIGTVRRGQSHRSCVSNMSSVPARSSIRRLPPSLSRSHSPLMWRVFLVPFQPGERNEKASPLSVLDRGFLYDVDTRRPLLIIHRDQKFMPFKTNTFAQTAAANPAADLLPFCPSFIMRVLALQGWPGK